MTKLVRTLALPLCLVLARPLAAQVTTVDQGSFTVSRNGTVTGREEFSIRSTPGVNRGQPTYVGQATSTYDGTHLSPAVSTDAQGGVVRYQLETKTGTLRTAFLTAQVTQGRWVAREQTPRGESANQLFVSDGTIVLDHDVFYQYWFVVPRAGLDSTALPASIPTIDPSRRAVARLTLRDAGRETLTIGDSSIAARHIVLADPAGATRDLWLDAGDHVLKVAIPAEGVVAVRDEPPK